MPSQYMRDKIKAVKASQNLIAESRDREKRMQQLREDITRGKDAVANAEEILNKREDSQRADLKTAKKLSEQMKAVITELGFSAGRKSEKYLSLKDQYDAVDRRIKARQSQIDSVASILRQNRLTLSQVESEMNALQRHSNPTDYGV